MKNTINHEKNDSKYLELKYPHQEKPFASVQKWVYELLFHKKGYYEVTDESTKEKLKWSTYVGPYTSLICGPTRKMKLINRYGDEVVEIQFKNGQSQYLRVGSILTVWGWKYLLQNLENIVLYTTGEILYHSL